MGKDKDQWIYKIQWQYLQLTTQLTRRRITSVQIATPVAARVIFAVGQNFDNDQKMTIKGCCNVPNR